MAKKTTTLYMSDTSIRLMVTRGKRIHKIAELPLDVSLGDIGTEGKEAEVAAGIRSLFKNNKVKINKKKIIIGLSGLHCLSRPLTLPELPKAMLVEAITREAGRVMPVPLEQLYTSWQILSVSEGKISAFMVAIPKQIADTIIRVLGQAGLKPKILDIKPMALARLAREANALIVDIQDSEFDIILLVNSIPQPIRTLPFPEEKLSLAEKLLIVRDEVQRTVQFYNSNNPETPIQPDSLMLVSGELSNEPELAASLAEETGFQSMPLISPLKYPDTIDPSLYLANVGLALIELAKEAGPLVTNFNMLPTPYQPRQISLKGLIYVPIAAAAIAIVFLLVTNLQETAANIDSLHDQLDSTNVLLAQRQGQKKVLMESVEEIEQKLAGMETNSNDYVVALNSINTKGDLMNDDLEATVDNVVNGMELSRIGRIAGQMTVMGRVASEQEVLEYVRKLDVTGRFTEITIDSLKKTCTSDNITDIMDFSLAIRLEDPE